MPSRLALIASSSILALVLGCTNSPSSIPADSGAPQTTPNNPDECAGAVARITPSYVVNTALGASGGFTVDANGMVLGLTPDLHNDVPNLIQTASLEGTASTVYTYPT